MAKYSRVPAQMQLWKHQRGAIKFAIAHLKGSSNPCLIRMPTGTGKTGVIACLSMQSCSGMTLVLSPWVNLREQMVQALKRDFWESINFPPPKGSVKELLPSTAKATLNARDTKVLVGTFQTLAELRREKPLVYADLAKAIDLIIVDECHYEPAVEWGRAVKSLAKPMVLMTATPYRNDLKLFRIEDIESSVYQYTHEHAENDKIVRSLRFDSLKSGTDIRTTAKSFAKKWKAAIKSGTLASQSPRAIICCGTGADISAVVDELSSAKLSVVGIHETFNGKADKKLVKDVPGTDDTAQIWVHQNKLTEGLDDHRFCCVAFLDDINSDRKLIQQIGRVLRTHPSDNTGVPALVLSCAEYKHDLRWNAYRDFEKDAQLQSARHYRQVVEKMLESQPTVEYFDGRFRRKFRPDLLSKDPQVAISPSVLVRAVQPSFNFDDYVEDCTDSLNLSDAIILGSNPNGPCIREQDFALWVYASVVNSRLLEDTSLYEVRLEAHCAVLANNFLLVSDTTGTYPEAVIDGHTAGVGASELGQLLDDQYRLTNVAVSSAVPFDTVLRASEHRSVDMKRIPASLTDRIQICRSARGAKAKSRRYIGMQRGRVREELSERDRRRHNASVFRRWAQSVAQGLAAAVGAQHSVLLRYMQPTSAPAVPIPVAISVDLFRKDLKLRSSTDKPLIVAQSSVEVRPSVPTGSTSVFECDLLFFIDGDETQKQSVRVLVEHQRNKNRFWFKSHGHSDVQVLDDQGGRGPVRRNLVDYLNQHQDLILIGLSGGELVYQGKNFYRIDYSHAERSLVDSIVRATGVSCTTEKGTKAQLAQAKLAGRQATQFLSDSLFKVIAEEHLPLPFSPELIVCDDLGTECSDFVVANFTTKQMALVHAKAGKGAGISASAFHEVVAQAMKNLAYLTRNAEQPQGVPNWVTASKWNNTSIPTVYKSPAGCPSGPALWEKLHSEILDAAGAQLYVVLATTGCCDHQALSEAVKDSTKRTAQTAQLVHLVDSLVGYARQLGVSVSVVDVPFTVPTRKAAKNAAKKIVGKAPAAKNVNAPRPKSMPPAP